MDVLVETYFNNNNSNLVSDLRVVYSCFYPHPLNIDSFDFIVDSVVDFKFELSFFIPSINIQPFFKKAYFYIKNFVSEKSFSDPLLYSLLFYFTKKPFCIDELSEILILDKDSFRTVLSGESFSVVYNNELIFPYYKPVNSLFLYLPLKYNSVNYTSIVPSFFRFFFF